VTGDSFTGALSRVTGENIGTRSITKNTLALSGNYALTYTGADLTITSKAIAVTAAAKTKTYGDTDPALTYTFTPALVTGDSFTGALSRVTGENIGTRSITKNTLALSGNYALTYTGADLTITSKAIAVAAEAKSKTYGDTDPALTYTFAPALVTGDSFTGALSRVAGENAGSYAINQNTLVLSGNYALTYTNANLVIGKKALTITADNKTKTYGTANPALTPIYSGFVTGDNAASLTTAPTLTTTATTASPVASYPITATGAASSNYTIAYAPGTLTVTKAALTITATDPAKAYGTALTEGIGATGFTATAAQNGETATSVTLTPDAAGLAAATAAGATYTVTPSAATGANGFVESNYNVTYVPFTGTVAKRVITVTAAAKTKVYGDTDPGLTYTFTPALIGRDGFSGSLSRIVSENTGTYAIGKNTLALSTNYTLNYTGADLTITKANLTIAADNKSKSYGTANPALTVTYTGLVNGDTNASLTTQPTVTTTAGTNSAVGAYPITANGAVSSNYTITYTAGTLTINNVVLTVTVDNKTKIYGSANPALTVTYSGFVNGDTPAGITTLPTITTAAVTGSNVAVYAITASGVVIPGYTIAYVPGTLTVSKAPLTITADNKAKIFGTVNPTLTANYIGFVNGDTNASLIVQPTLTNTATATTVPGSYDIAVSSATSNNYTITHVSGKLTIIPLTASTLSNLSVSSAALSPVFIGATTAYASSVSYDVERVTVTANFDPTAGATINGTPIPNGSPSFDIVVPVGTSTITVIVTAQDGITKTSYTVTLYKASPPTAIIPTNILSPNGDGKNDGWVVKDIELFPDNEVTIYDKGGREVFRKKGYHNDWDGTIGGATLSQGTYFYVVEFGPGIAPVKGFITILRNQQQ
jgi:gliding motility-associated-like protein